MLIRNLKGKRKKKAMRNFCKISSLLQSSMSSTSTAIQQLTEFVEENVIDDSESSSDDEQYQL
jgi:hypothetical protein